MQAALSISGQVSIPAGAPVGWRVSRSAHAGFVLAALEQALRERRPVAEDLIHHSDRGVQYVSVT